MEASDATSLIFAKHQAKLAAALAGKMANVNPGAAREAASMMTESAEQFERVATEIAVRESANVNILV